MGNEVLDSLLESGTWIVQVDGSYPEDGGTTKAAHRLIVGKSFELSGEETWSWTGPDGICPGGEGLITATRISGP